MDPRRKRSCVLAMSGDVFGGGDRAVIPDVTHDCAARDDGGGRNQSPRCVHRVGRSARKLVGRAICVGICARGKRDAADRVFRGSESMRAAPTGLRLICDVTQHSVCGSMLG